MPLIKIIKEGFDKEYDYFRVKKENSIKFNKLYNEIFKYAIVKKKSIPFKILDEFLMILEDVTVENDILYASKEKEVIEKVLEYFKNYPDYQFSKKSYEWCINKNVTENFESLVRVVIIELMQRYFFQMGEKGKDKYDSPQKVICDAYEMIEWNLKGVHKYSDYQKSVLSGYIAISFGFSLVDIRKPLTNPRIFQATRNALKKKPATK